ncbi:MAG: hypothetical protein UR89_C0004G0029 [Candidatus Roizmanbacteria bacterium GW2011_GWA2_35_8]|uniref:Cupin 2 conserved barrel domain-containing protein n=1 Tax=Candidatus Roizmanbacteria bacterium GW2011_GWA2_35_8 TaxID=1618479 RepID=A0A0G0FI98_9BACT|nr:MAG: hypothetical protein UR89_C0004G0029 [Candidatus Roizmanbacteria bacterium GW2011_GWA2_35_8]
MKTHVLKLPKDYSFEKVGIKGKKYFAQELTKKSGFVFVETEKGHQTIIVNHKIDCFYFVLEGNGYFKIDDVRETFSKYDLIVIPAESKFTYKGKAIFLRITTPPYYPEQEETLQ